MIVAEHDLEHFLISNSSRTYISLKGAFMKRIGYLAGILFIALCLFASAYGERSDQTPKQRAMTSQQEETQMIEAQIDHLAERMSQLKSDMAAVKLELMQSGKGSRRNVTAR